MNKFHFLALLIVTLDVCVAFLVKNDNGANNKTSLQDGHSSASQSIQDLTTLLVEEKRLRFQLEDRLNNIENKVNQVDLFHNEVTKELLKERSNRQQLETTYFNLKMELDNLTNICNIAQDASRELSYNHSKDMNHISQEFATLSKERNENDLKIANLSTSLNMAKDQITVLANYTAILDHSSKSNENGTFVGFSVSMASQSSVSASNPLRVNSVVYNDGGDFNVSASVFLCRQPGLYFFTFSFVHHHKGGYSYCCLHKNSGRSLIQCAVAGDNTSSRYSTGTTSGVLSLKKGDKVYVGECTDPEDLDVNTNWTGFLIEPK